MPELRLRIEETLRKKIEEAASSAGVSMNSEVMSRLKNSFERDKLDSPSHEEELTTRDIEFLEKIVRFIAALNARERKGHWSNEFVAYVQMESALHSLFHIYTNRARLDEKKHQGKNLYEMIAMAREVGNSSAQILASDEIDRQNLDMKARSRKEPNTDATTYFADLQAGILKPSKFGKQEKRPQKKATK